ncbi:hypothetical protein B0H19DRAFT_1276306 [Mycena capillaripes]|nr:hypothetical protein B0H19DRAFT_1276306 [Mycena capillaripes]
MESRSLLPATIHTPLPVLRGRLIGIQVAMHTGCKPAGGNTSKVEEETDMNGEVQGSLSVSETLKRRARIVCDANSKVVRTPTRYTHPAILGTCRSNLRTSTSLRFGAPSPPTPTPQPSVSLCGVEHDLRIAILAPLALSSSHLNAHRYALASVSYPSAIETLAHDSYRQGSIPLMLSERAHLGEDRCVRSARAALPARLPPSRTSALHASQKAHSVRVSSLFPLRCATPPCAEFSAHRNLNGYDAALDDVSFWLPCSHHPLLLALSSLFPLLPLHHCFALPFIILALVVHPSSPLPPVPLRTPTILSSIADCVSLVFAPSPRSFSFAHHTHRSSVHLPSYSAPSLLLPSPLRSIFTNSNPRRAVLLSGRPLFNTASSSVTTICGHGAHQALSHRMSIATLRAKARLKPRRSTTSTRIRGLHHQSFLGAHKLRWK